MNPVRNPMLAGVEIMPNVYAYLWFDIEDYVTKQSDDLPLTAFQILRRYNVPVTCKVVAEKIRALQANGRVEVIKAISNYDVGYHLDTHSRHPTLYEYLVDLDVRTGAKEFLARESDGYALVKDLVGKAPSCFGHPGPTWAPQVYPALSELGVSVYLDETSILNLDNEPYWYCGLLNLNGANRNFIVFDYTFEDNNGTDVLKERFKEIYNRLQKGRGGAVSILFHLHTLINRKFWDEVNFGNGKNREKQEYERPPAQPPEVTKRGWKKFEEFIRYITGFENVTFITATDALKLYQPQTPHSLVKSQLQLVAKHFGSSTDYFDGETLVLSPSEAFYVIVKSLAECGSTGKMPEQVETMDLLGPLASFRSRGKHKLKTIDLIDSASTSLESISVEGYVPSRIDVGDYAALSPQDFLTTASRLFDKMLSNGKAPQAVNLSRGKLPNARYVSAANFKKACTWKVLPRKFEAPKILEQIKLQAWTLKPARPLGGTV